MRFLKSLLFSCYRAQTKLRKGNVFTSMCQEDTPQADTSLGRHPSGPTPSPDGILVDTVRGYMTNSKGIN